MKGEIVVVGLGPGSTKYLTREAEEILVNADEVYFRYHDHPAYKWLSEMGKNLVSFQPLYRVPGIQYFQVYRTINQALVKAAIKYGRVVYALPGNPCVFEKTPRWLKELAGPAEVGVRVVAGLSFLEMVYLELGLDPEEGVQILNASGFSAYGDYPFTEKLGLIVGQVGLAHGPKPLSDRSNIEPLARSLLKKFPPDHQVTLLWSSGMPDYESRSRTFPLSELASQQGFMRELATLYVPPLDKPWTYANKQP